MHAHTALPTVCTNIPNKISITCKVHWRVGYWRVLKFAEIKLAQKHVSMLVSRGYFWLSLLTINTHPSSLQYTMSVLEKTVLRPFCVMVYAARVVSPEKKLFLLYTWQSNHVGEKVSFLFCINYMSPQGNIPPMHALQNTHCRLPIMQFELRHKGEKRHLNLLHESLQPYTTVQN